MTTYKVSYIENGQSLAIPYRCPKYARQFFEQKKAQNIPCALIAIDGNDESTVIEGYK